MQIISDVTIGEGEAITPNTQYESFLLPSSRVDNRFNWCLLILDLFSRGVLRIMEMKHGHMDVILRAHQMKIFQLHQYNQLNPVAVQLFRWSYKVQLSLVHFKRSGGFSHQTVHVLVVMIWAPSIERHHFSHCFQFFRHDVVYSASDWIWHVSPDATTIRITNK